MRGIVRGTSCSDNVIARRNLIAGLAALVTGGATNLSTLLHLGTLAVAGTGEDNALNAVNVKDLGAVGDGVADDTAPVQSALNVGGKIIFPPGIYKITSPLNVTSNSVLAGQKGAVIQTAKSNISIIVASRKNNVVIEGLKIKQTVAGAKSAVGGIELYKSKDCEVRNCTFEGMQWAGVFLDGSTRCAVRGNNFSGWQGKVQDAADICVYQACVSCEITDNHCFGGGAHGILMQDPYAGLIPSKNMVSRNRIGKHTAYGITVYLPGASGKGDSFNQISDNYIENIQGSFASNRSSGAGIYVVGYYAGGTQITGNTVKNCCVKTLDRQLAPAGIGVNGIPYKVTKPVVANNTITGMTQGDGILITSSPGGAKLVDNSVVMPATNTGNGIGGPTMEGTGIFLNASSNVEVAGGKSVNLGDGSAFVQTANGTNCADITVTDGYYQSANSAAFRVNQTGGFATDNIKIADTTARNTGTANYGFSIANVTSGEMIRCTGYASSFEGLIIASARALRVSGGSFTSDVTPAITLSGHCAGTHIDRSVYFGTSPMKINNRSTGGTVHR